MDERMPMSRKRWGLRKLSPDLIAKARDDTSTQVTRILLTFVGTAVFCMLSLLTPDSALLAGNEKITVPLAGPVSFFGFILLGPTVLILLRVYLQIYVEHEHRLNRIAQRMPAGRAPTLLPLENPLMRGFGSFTLGLLLPLMALTFTWKAAVFPIWGSCLFCGAVAIIVGHLVLPLRKLSWRLRTLFGMGAMLLTAGVMIILGPLQRPFNLSRANLSDQLFRSFDFRQANLERVNLARANLVLANLENANLSNANLDGASLRFANLRYARFDGASLVGAILAGAKFKDTNFWFANLESANFWSANLEGIDFGGANLLNADLQSANLWDANLKGTNLKSANLMGVVNLTQQQVNETCCNEKTKLPPGLKSGTACQGW